MEAAKRAIVVLLAVAFIATAAPLTPPAPALAAVASSRVDPTLLKAVVRVFVKTSKRSYVGTGFIVSRAAEGRPDERHYYLVTNKHVIGDWNIFDADFREYAETVELTFFREGAPSPPVTVKISDGKGALDASIVLAHRNPIVDVAAIALTQDVLGFAPSTLTSFDVTWLLRSDRVTPLLAGLGDQVFAIGYPRAITSHATPYPIAKVGYLATQPGPALTFDVSGENRAKTTVSRKLTGTLILVDGLVLPGNSGGPVVVVADLKLRRNPTTNAVEIANPQMRNLVVGIVSLTLVEASGLMLAYGADYILEVVDGLDQARRATPR